MDPDKEALDQILGKLTELDRRLAKIETYLERQKGFLGGLLFLGSCVAWVASSVKDWFK